MAEVFVVDSETIIERLAGDLEIYWMMIDMYLQDLERNCAALSAAYRAGDAALLHREAHTLKGLLATFTDGEGSAQALAIERRAKDNDLAGLEAPIAALEQRLRLVGDALSQELAKRG